MTRTAFVCRALALALCCLTALAGSAPAAEKLDASQGDAWHAAPMDWPHWRGPEMNGVSRERNLVDRWSPRGGGENVLWRNEELGGRSTPIVMNGRLYTIVNDQPGTDREAEKVVCVDAATGEQLWENRFNVFLSDVPDTRVGWSSVVGDPATGRVYALGVCDLFLCIDGETGRTLWSRSLSEEYGMLNTYGGRTNFPVIVGDLVVISGITIGWGENARPSHRFIGFDKQDGTPVWHESTRMFPDDTTYSAPVVGVINGEAVLVCGGGDGAIHGFQPRTGKRLWTYNVSERGINTAPLIVGNMVVGGHSEENLNDNRMGALFAIDATKRGDISETGELWRVMEMFVGKSSPLVIDGRIYAIEDRGKLLVVDLKTGELIASQNLGTMGRGSPLYADGKIYCCEANGRWYILKPNEKGVEIIHRERLSGEEVNASPIVSHGRIYLQTSDSLYCIGDRDRQPVADSRPAPPQEAPVESDRQPAHVQVVPVEALLKPGENQQFNVRLYNARGQYLGQAGELGEQVTFSVEGAGQVDSNGKYTAPQGTGHVAAVVAAKVGELSGLSRVRVVPDLPWAFDFSEGQIPITWVGARYRHIIVDHDLVKSLETQSPLASQLYIYLMSGFTNSGRPSLTYDDTTPANAWTALLRFLNLIGKAGTLEQARQELDPALQLLADERVVSKWEWSTLDDGRVRFTVERGPRKFDGNPVMLKITTIPKGTRSQGWMGQTDLSDYTIQADVFGARKDGKLPDIGVTAQRYRLEMLGASQQLKLYSWISHEIKFKEVPFEWQPEAWYTMKLRASTEERDGREVAVLQGKVWPRDQAEPNDWHIEWTDEPANTSGSPGLFGNAKDAEIFYDNVKVFKN